MINEHPILTRRTFILGTGALATALTLAPRQVFGEMRAPITRETTWWTHH